MYRPGQVIGETSERLGRLPRQENAVCRVEAPSWVVA